MNIAISSILVFIFLLPGITFRRLYYTEEFSKQYFKQNFFELFSSAFIPSVLIHVLICSLLSLLSFKVNIEVIGQLLASKAYPSAAFENINKNISQIILYQLLVLSVGGFSGYTVKKIIRYWNFDIKKKVFRFRNNWHYIATGEFFDFKRADFDLIEDTVASIDVTHVDALVSTSEGTIIYDGFLVDYELSPTGGLANITLKDVQRRMLKNDNITTENRYYKIPGHILVIPYTSIINLNFSYYKFVEIEGELNQIGIELVK